MDVSDLLLEILLPLLERPEELVTVREGDREVPLYRWIAQRLAGDLKLPVGELPERLAGQVWAASGW